MSTREFEPKPLKRNPNYDPDHPDLGRFMAAIRQAETGSPEGNYNLVGPMQRGYQGRGAYQISLRNWEVWSQDAGVAGADWRSPEAQDLVAASVMGRMYQRYGNWGLVAAAWLAGPQVADHLASIGFVASQNIENETISGYVNQVTNALAAALTAPWTGTYQTPVVNYGAPGGWIHPIAGEADWGRGSWMPNTLTHRGRTHPAIDIYAKAGTPIVSPVSGKVISTKVGDIGGNTVRVQGDDGNIYYFAHMKSQAVVENGQRISAGAHLGFVGDSGSAKGTSPHLHLGIRRGESFVNPATLLEGATQGGGSFSMNPDVGVAQETTGGMSRMLNGWMSSMSNAVAGGERTDHRELTLAEPEPADEPESDSMTQRALRNIGLR